METAEQPRATSAGGSTRLILLELAILSAIALLIRLVHLGEPPHPDELFHVLAAKSWLAEGTLQITEGGEPYTRARLFTYLVIGSFRLFGESLAVARLPSVVAGTIWVLLVFLFVRQVAGRLAAWIAAALFCFDPGAIHLSQWVRFYAPQGALVWAGTYAAYDALTNGHSNRKRLALGIASVGAFALALHLQLTTIIAIAGASIWAGAYLLTRASDLRDLVRRYKWVVAGALGIGAIALVVALETRIAHRFWWTYQGVAPWAVRNREYLSYYNDLLVARYPILWSLFPVAIFLSLKAAPRSASLFVSIFITAFLAHSFAPQKAERYIYYAIPFFFATWGIALATVLPALSGEMGEWLAKRTWMPSQPRVKTLAGWVSAVLILLFVGLVNLGSARRAFTMSLHMLVFTGDQRPHSYANWAAATPVLKPLTDSTSIVISSSTNKTLYYLESPHMEFRATTERELRELMRCNERGLVIVEPFHWSRDYRMTAAAADLILDEMDPVELQEDRHLMAFQWRTSLSAPEAVCPKVQLKVPIR